MELAIVMPHFICSDLFDALLSAILPHITNFDKFSKQSHLHTYRTQDYGAIILVWVGMRL